CRLGELPLLDEADRMHLRHLEGSPSGAAPACLHRLLDAQACQCPEAPAVRYGERTLSYGELQRQANRLARRLRELGVGPDVPVGIFMTRSPDLVVALLAVLKAGGAYVPLDPDYPRERLAYLIDDSRSALLLIQAELRARLPAGVRTPVLSVDELAESSHQGLLDECDASDAVQPQNLAYIIYTSGSTGRPKGVGISHQALVNHMLWMLKRFDVQPSERVLQRTSVSFDAAVWEFWLPLLAGAQLHLAPVELGRDLSALWPLVERERISVLQLPPSLLQALLPLASTEQLRGLRLLCCGGEALAAGLVRVLRDKWGGELLNLYGPTEATIDTCCHSVPAAATGPTIALGKPIDGLRIRLLDPSGGRTPWGGRGELAIAGAGLARGYLRRPGLTAERFVPDPESHGERLYRSGDLARIDGEGQVDYLGRIDQQVKLRGYRIELGEIEARLLQQAVVRQAVVVAREGASGLQLVGYVVPSDPERPAPDTLGDTLKAALRTALPEFMVPAAWVVLETLPLTPNGKLDRRALPPPDLERGRQAFQAPGTALERTLAAVWSEVLQLERVGLGDDFFALGGHSLLATQILTRLRERLDVEVALRDLFEFPTLGELARQLDGRSGKGAEVQDKLAKSLVALKRLTTEEIDALTS
ncbi:amino acid adenylation domain-containing protein, partial [Pseudomonas sp. No.117]